VADTPEYVIPEPSQSEVTAIATHVGLIDALDQGVGMDALRVFYPKLGWGKIQKRLEAAISQGLLTSQVVAGIVKFKKVG
jgi:hypothetical protein